MKKFKNLAWQVTEEDGNGCIVFERRNVSARRLGARKLGVDFKSARCCRARKYDKYSADGIVPKKILLGDGWWFECHYCGSLIFDSDLIEDVVAMGQNVYCNQSCKDNHDKEQEARLS